MFKSTVNTFLTAMVLLLNLGLYAQVKLTVFAADSLPFVLYVQNEQINLKPVTEIGLTGLPSGKTSIKAMVQGNTTATAEQVLNLKPQTQVSFEIKLVKTAWKIVPVSEAAWIPAAEKIIIDSAIIAPTAVETSTNSRCTEAMSTEAMNSLKTKIADQHFEAKKLELMKREIASSCLKVDQLLYLLTLLEIEDNKINLAESFISQTFDPQRLNLLESAFFLDKNKVRIRQSVAPHLPTK
jgi:hypothetical protein